MFHVNILCNEWMISVIGVGVGVVVLVYVAAAARGLGRQNVAAWPAAMVPEAERISVRLPAISQHFSSRHFATLPAISTRSMYLLL